MPARPDLDLDAKRLIQVRVNERLYRALHQAAVEADRSLNREIQRRLKQSLGDGWRDSPASP
jgi:predicted HicB family RNase H-like nuclease